MPHTKGRNPESPAEGSHPMKWFRLYDELIDDPKIMEMTNSTFRVFIYLLCLANKGHTRGIVRLYNKDKDLRKTLKRRLRMHHKSVYTALVELEEMNIITCNGDEIQINKWGKRQFKSDDVTARVKRFRNVTETPPETDTDTETETDNVSSPSSAYAPDGDSLKSTKGFVDNGKGSKPRCPHQKIIALYHEILPELSEVQEWNEYRQGLLRTVWRGGGGRQDLDWWRKFFYFVRSQPHLMGNNSRGWTANLEWLIRPRNFPKVVEGYYLPRKHPLRGKFSETTLDNIQVLKDWRPE